ncbi:MAG: carbohydrate ABC transporter permease [Blautia sp.]|jgi:multiple sugar transport system permease protein
MRRKKQKKLTNYTSYAIRFHLPTFITLTLITLIPLLYTLKISFFDYQLSSPGSESVFVGFKNYVTLFEDPELLNSISKTFLFMIFSVTLEVIIGIALALALNSIPVFRRLFTSLTLIPVMVAPLVIGLMFSFFTNPQFGLYVWLVTKLHLPLPTVLTDNSVTAMAITIFMDVWEWAPYLGLTFLAGLQSISGEFYEAAEVDGASRWQTFWFVTLPQMKPVLAVGILLRAMETFKEFDKPYILTGGGPGNATEVIDIYTYRQAFVSFRFSYAAAICVILFLILVACGMIYQKAAMGGDD